MNSNKKSACGTATATSTMNNKTNLIISSAAEKVKAININLLHTTTTY